MNEIEEILLDEETIRKKVEELASQISRDYAGRELIVVCILKGAIAFTADLVRRLTVPVELDFVRAASYGKSTKSSREIVISKDIDADIEGRHVLLADCIIDTGETLDPRASVFATPGKRSSSFGKGGCGSTTSKRATAYFCGSARPSSSASPTNSSSATN